MEVQESQGFSFFQPIFVARYWPLHRGGLLQIRTCPLATNCTYRAPLCAVWASPSCLPVEKRRKKKGCSLAALGSEMEVTGWWGHLVTHKLARNVSVSPNQMSNVCHKLLKCAFPRTALLEINPKEISEKCRRTQVKDINQSGVYSSKKKKKTLNVHHRRSVYKLWHSFIMENHGCH